MTKMRNSTKGEYGINYEVNNADIRNFQELLNLRNSQLAAVKEGFDVPEHKMEFVKNIRGVDFINDSAAENANGIYLALSNITKPVTWITSFTQWNNIDVELLQLIIRKVNSIIFYGEEDELTRNFIDALNIRRDRSTDLEVAVRTAFYTSSQDEAVLFCPGTPASGKFENYAERGEEFKQSVAQL